MKLGVLMDPLASIRPHKDSTLAMLLAAQARGHTLFYMEMADLWLADGRPHAHMRRVRVRDDARDWYSLEEPATMPLDTLDAILMRKDPPFDTEYIYATYLLERAAGAGVLVVNHPRALRDANEKLFTAWFPQCCAPTLVARDAALVREFIDTHGDIVLKPLGGMGGESIFRIVRGDPNTNVVIETLTAHGTRFAMAQRYIPEIASGGDKRILLIDGEPVPYALARMPAPGEHRGNLAAGGRGQGVPLSERDRWICAQVSPALKEKGLLFVGLDVIGDYLTEINVTSPTCIRELDREYGLDIAGDLIQCIEKQVEANRT